MPITQLQRKKIKRTTLNCLGGLKLGFSIGAGLTKATLNTANDMAEYFTDVHLPNRIGGWLECGLAKAGNVLYKGLQKKIMKWR